MSDTTKLPKWAQEHIKDLHRQRDQAISALNKLTDAQTPASFYVDDHVGTGEEAGPTMKRRYFQGSRISIAHAGVLVDVILSRENDSQRPFGVCLQFSSEERHLGYVALIPTGFNQVALVSKNHMDR